MQYLSIFKKELTHISLEANNFFFSGQAWAVAGHHGDDKHSRDIPYLNDYADRKWEVSLSVVLNYTDFVEYIEFYGWRK